MNCKTVSLAATNSEDWIQSLTEKSLSFLQKDFVAPTAFELRSLRRHLGLNKEQASHRIGVSLRTWSSRESRTNVTPLREEEFAMVILFLIRQSPCWPRIQASLQGPGAIASHQVKRTIRLIDRNAA